MPTIAIPAPLAAFPRVGLVSILGADSFEDFAYWQRRFVLSDAFAEDRELVP